MHDSGVIIWFSASQDAINKTTRIDDIALVFYKESPRHQL